jgi:alcohol dehydrogenase
VEAATALVLTGPRRLERRQLPLGDLEPGEAWLRVEACGLCGTDHEQFTGALPVGAPFIPGHEIVGTIETITPEARAARDLAAGDRVAVEVFQACGTCDPCRRGASMLCARHGLRDMYGGTPVDVGPGLWGGYATHVVVSRDARLHRVPASLDPVAATLFNPLGAGLRWAVELPELEPGAVLAVLGPGIRGLCALVAARDAGAAFVLVTGSGPADERRLALAEHLGAVAVDVTAEDPVAALRRDAGQLADVVVDVTAAAPAAFGQALALARPGGTVVVAGTRGAAVEGFNPDLLVFKELRVLGARGVDTGAYAAALRLLAHDTRLTGLPARLAPLAVPDVTELLEDLAHGHERPLRAVIVPGADPPPSPALAP